jgi:hypothetical protein
MDLHYPFGNPLFFSFYHLNMVLYPKDYSMNTQRTILSSLVTPFPSPTMDEQLLTRKLFFCLPLFQSAEDLKHQKK